MPITWKLEVYNADGSLRGSLTKAALDDAIRIHGDTADLAFALADIIRSRLFFTDPDAIAGAAYTAYCQAVGGKSITGDPLPAWSGLKLDPAKSAIVAAWLSAGRAALACTPSLN